MSDSVRPSRREPTRLPRPWDSPGKNTGVGCHFLLQCMKVKSEREVTQSCLTLSDPMDCSPPGSSVYGIFQARVLEWGATAFSNTAVESPLKTSAWRHVQIFASPVPWPQSNSYSFLNCYIVPSIFASLTRILTKAPKNMCLVHLPRI